MITCGLQMKAILAGYAHVLYLQAHAQYCAWYCWGVGVSVAVVLVLVPLLVLLFVLLLVLLSLSVLVLGLAWNRFANKSYKDTINYWRSYRE